MYGRWDADPAAQRRKVRLELYRFLENHGDKADAQAELAAFAADLPADPSLHIQAGNLFLSANDYDRALKEFQQALRLGGSQAEALAGAGKAVFLMADYDGAQRYLERAVRAIPSSLETIHLLETTHLLLEITPFDPRLTAEQRNHRVVRAFEQARTRLESCAQERHEVLDTDEPQTTLQALYARARKLQPKAREGALRRDPEAAAAILNLSLEIEQITARSCGPPSGLDRALLLLAEKHGGAQS
jgi:tetratricopeptide (TPR) repeat protein